MHGVEVGSTARLRFRAVTDVDVSRLFTLMGDPRVKRGEPRSPAPNHPSFVDTIKSMINMAVFSVIIEAREPPAAGKGVRDASDAPDIDLFVGRVFLYPGVPKNRSVDIAISLEPRWWGQGLGTEAVRFALDHAFAELNVHRVGLDCLGNNARAVGAYKRAGFVEECRAREEIWQNGEWVDGVKMGILRREWEATEQK